MILSRRCPTLIPSLRLLAAALVLSSLAAAPWTFAADWPMYGGSSQRNMANLVEKNIATDWSVEEGKQKNIKWSADLGTYAYGGPVIARGKVYVGTNNAKPRDPKMKGKNKAVLMAFSEVAGKFLWQIVHDIPDTPTYQMVVGFGLLSTPTIDGDRIYYVTPSCEVICAGADDGQIKWRYDMMKELKVVPFHCGNCAPLVAGDRVFLITGNGNEDGKIASPKAPSFIALDKNKGTLLWQSNLPGTNILEGQWSNPALAKINGKQQIIFPGGDAVLYGLEPETGKMIWKFQCNPGPRVPDVTLNYPIATPVVYDNHVFLALGVYPDHPMPTRSSYMLCVDATKNGDVSPKGLNPEGARPGSALVWAYGGMVVPRPKKGRAAVFGPSLSTAAIHDGLVYISELAGYMHCLDAKTGQKYWDHDFKAGVWGSPYYVDGKVYQGTDDGSVVVFEAGKKHKVIRQMDMEDTVQGTPAVANGVLYVATKSKLFAIAAKK